MWDLTASRLSAATKGMENFFHWGPTEIPYSTDLVQGSPRRSSTNSLWTSPLSTLDCAARIQNSASITSPCWIGTGRAASTWTSHLLVVAWKVVSLKASWKGWPCTWIFSDLPFCPRPTEARMSKTGLENTACPPEGASWAKRRNGKSRIEQNRIFLSKEPLQNG